MQRHNKGNKRIRNLILVSSFTAVVLMVSTYAWFIGMRTVNVTSFDVEIAATESLMLSLDGKVWKDTIEFTKENLFDKSYATHTNSWGELGLIPLSTIGAMDEDASRMVLFEKASLTASPGGYRLMASRVKNYGVNAGGEKEPEKDGYVAFDLFVKNFSGTQYIKELEELDEEAIYLTVDSEVTVGEGGVKETGIENSVRIAFTQIGRVIGTETDEGKITGITCESETDGEGNITGDVTGICREAQIWEPNDTDHVQNAIKWYNKSCLARTGAIMSASGAYSGACQPVVDGKATTTYAITKEIGSEHQVDIYDGKTINGYEGSAEFLKDHVYFTDSMKNLRGTQRPTFMTLAPNSITKIRIYIYIEGQDIDNYDFAAIGKQISIKFGFTKQRYTEDDIIYDGPDVNRGEGPDGADLTAPVITLLGVEGNINPMKVILGSEFTDPGVTVEDNVDGTITNVDGQPKKITASGKVDTSVLGTYTITYKAKDNAGNIATKTRTVTVEAE